MEKSKNHHHHHQQQRQQYDQLGLKKMSKNITKKTNHESVNRSSSSQVYNISKSEFRSVVQRLTGSSSSSFSSNNNNDANSSDLDQQEQLPKRLQQLRPPPLAPVVRPASVSVPAIPSKVQPSQMTEYVRFLESSLLSVREQNNCTSTNMLLPSSTSPAVVLPSPWPILSPGFGLSPPVMPSMSPNWRDML